MSCPPPLKLTELLYAYDLAIAARTCDTVAAVCLSVVIYGDERVKHALTRKDVIILSVLSCCEASLLVNGF